MEWLNEQSGHMVYIIDKETGSFVERELYDGQQVRIVNERSIEAFYRLKDGKIDIHRDQVYTKTYPDGLMLALSMGLSPTELALMNAAQCFAIKFNTGLLVHENMVPVRSEHLIEVAHISPRSYYSAMSSLISNGILAKERKGRSDAFYANPFIFQCGNSIDMDLYRRFEKTVFAQSRKDYVVIRRKEKHD